MILAPKMTNLIHNPRLSAQIQTLLDTLAAFGAREPSGSCC